MPKNTYLVSGNEWWVKPNLSLKPMFFYFTLVISGSFSFQTPGIEKQSVTRRIKGGGNTGCGRLLSVLTLPLSNQDVIQTNPCPRIWNWDRERERELWRKVCERRREKSGFLWVAVVAVAVAGIPQKCRKQKRLVWARGRRRQMCRQQKRQRWRKKTFWVSCLTSVPGSLPLDSGRHHRILKTNSPSCLKASSSGFCYLGPKKS